MKNEMIVAIETQQLVEKGIIKSNAQINTYQGWKERGYQVRRGEKAISQFPIWKMVTSKKTGDEIMFLKKSFWFSDNQVDKI